ncbi:MAG TPA: nuclear transport factor 2 family protein [Terriglobales bacterium]
MPQHARAEKRHLIPSGSLVFSVVLGLVLTGCTIGRAPKHPNWKNATGAEQYERLMWQAIREKNWKDVEYRLAPTFVGVNQKGAAFDRAGWLEYWKSVTLTDFSLGELKVQPNGPDMTITYVLELNGGRSASLFRVVSVWQQVKGGWRLIACSHTSIQAN